MSLNKYALIRYRVINQCLKDFTYATKAKLKEACEEKLEIAPISDRTIAEDIYSMRSDDRLGYNAPIKFDKGRRAYYYSDPDYSIDNFPLNQEEILTLSFASTLLNQFNNVELFKRFTGSVQKIVDAVKVYRLSEEKETLDFIDFEKVPTIKGSEHLPVLIKAIRLKKVVYIKYRAFYSEKDHHHDIHPYLLKEYRHRWYLTGHHDYWNEIRTYGLDRIVSIKIKDDKKYCDSGFSPKEYFANTIGIFSPLGEPPEIILEFKKETAQYILTQPIHESQEVEDETEDTVTIILKVHPTVEFIQLILGWGSEVKVISPDSLKEMIVNQLKESLKSYT